MVVIPEDRVMVKWPVQGERGVRHGRRLRRERLHPPRRRVDLSECRASHRDGRQRGSRCGPAQRWHVEEWPGVGQVAVPDRATVLRRYSVGD
jgi:hypothetical protein